MARSHAALVEAAREAISAVESDTTVLVRKTIESLEELNEHISASLVALYEQADGMEEDQ